MRIAYIMRGVAGSGKSTRARQLAGEKGVIHSTDDFFHVDGQYRFDARLLPQNHARNLEAFCRSLAQGVEVVVCDNTNAKRWHFEPYIKATEDAGYVIRIVSMPHPAPDVAARRTIHRVPAKVIQRIIEGWED